MEGELRALLDHLAGEAPRSLGGWRGWRVEPFVETISGTTYRATRGETDLGVKFFTRDPLDRAGREYACLSALHEAGLRIAPEPVLLDRERYERPVVARTWLSGEEIEHIPEDDAGWEAILAHLLAVHSVTREKVETPVSPAATTMCSAASGLALLEGHLARELPEEGDVPPDLKELLGELERASYPRWPRPPTTLCRGDCNRYNFLFQGHPAERRCVSFDWEYGGWGDPAFEVADLICAPTFVRMPEERREWIPYEYAARSGDETAAGRARTYRCLMNAWWAVRFARFLKDLRREEPQSHDRHDRLAGAYAHRVALAVECLGRL
jgi:thiamine kinase-like enzyme